MNLTAAWTATRAGQQVTFRPRGSSMAGLVPDGAEVLVHPARPETLEPGDVVLVKVAGSIYLHKVLAVDHGRRRVQIGNNRGRVNGWTGFDRVAGIAVRVNGVPRPATRGKTYDPDPQP